LRVGFDVDFRRSVTSNLPVTLAVVALDAPIDVERGTWSREKIVLRSS